MTAMIKAPKATMIVGDIVRLLPGIPLSVIGGSAAAVARRMELHIRCMRAGHQGGRTKSDANDGSQ
jgi:hypothetical protein